MLNKSEVISHLVELQEEKVDSLKKSLKSSEMCAKDSPGSNKSHSDTSKFQYSNLALGFKEKIINAEELLSNLRLLDISEKNIVCLGSLIKIKDKLTNDTFIYFIIQSGGDVLTIDNIKITSLTLKAPFARVFFRKKNGDEVIFRDKTYEILNIK